MEERQTDMEKGRGKGGMPCFLYRDLETPTRMFYKIFSFNAERAGHCLFRNRTFNV